MITLFPDLTLAVEEGEPELAHDFFSTVKVGLSLLFVLSCRTYDMNDVLQMYDSLKTSIVFASLLVCLVVEAALVLGAILFLQQGF